MIDKNIEDIIEQYFKINGGIRINANSVVDVNGDVELKKPIDSGQLPVKFGHVIGNFNISQGHLKTLKGCPHRVDGNFTSSMNSNATLEHAPEKVGGSFIILASMVPLTSITALPKIIGYHTPRRYTVVIPWNDNLGLLPLITNEIHYEKSDKKLELSFAPAAIKTIMMKYADLRILKPAEANRFSVQCAMELIKAGYRNNARL